MAAISTYDLQIIRSPASYFLPLKRWLELRSHLSLQSLRRLGAAVSLFLSHTHTRPVCLFLAQPHTHTLSFSLSLSLSLFFSLSHTPPLPPSLSPFPLLFFFFA